MLLLWRYLYPPVRHCGIILRFDSQMQHYFSNVAAKLPRLESPGFSDTEMEKSYPQHLCRIVDEISQLSLLEVADLSELLQKKLKIQAPTAMAATIPALSTTPDASTEEASATAGTKSSFLVKLVNFDPSKKVPLIKEIKQIIADMNLVQAKKFVESVPGTVKADVSKDEAEEIKKTLEAVGATVEIE